MCENFGMNFRQKFIVPRNDCMLRSLVGTGQSAMALTLLGLTASCPWEMMVPRYLTVSFSNWHLTSLQDSLCLCMVSSTCFVQWRSSSSVSPRMMISSI